MDRWDKWEAKAKEAMAKEAMAKEMMSKAGPGVKFYLISFVDLLGVVRSKLVPTSAMVTVCTTGASFAGYAAHFDMTAADPDLFAIPDWKSVIRLPWMSSVAWIASDLYMNGSLLAQAPRQVLKDQIAKANALGYRMKTGVECEFFLLSDSPECKLSDSKDARIKPCYEQGALMRRYEVISELMLYMQQLGWQPYQADHEDANGQFELNWEYDDCLVTADRHVFFKFMVKSVAEKHGFKATFMPKPFLDRTGNGAHCHVSLWDKSGTVNLFYDAYEQLGLSVNGYLFIGGILANAKALCAILNPTVNSFKRIDGHSTTSGSSWAPTTISYTGNNRTHLLRIPDKGRFEVRLADGAVNAYLLQAAILASGLNGIVKKLDPGQRCDWNGHMPAPKGVVLQSLPANLLDALRELDASEYLKEALGKEFVTGYLKLQMDEWRSYARHLSQWELANCLDI